MITRQILIEHNYIHEVYNGGKLDVYKKWFKGDDERGCYICVRFYFCDEQPFETMMVFPSQLYSINHLDNIDALEKLRNLLLCLPQA